ncbi:MAG: hypothetical protein K2J25_05965 [Oscillospiraceae bacterium]|nr:hypothetical protein [Oscillospiraceae bacterium]
MKSKGIMIELTSLLDVIFIILFGVMMQLQEEQEQIKIDTESQLAEANQQVENALQQVEDIRKEADEKIAEAWQTAEELNSKAFSNQKALNSFAQGNFITIYLEYMPNGIITITEQRNTLAEISLELSENSISEKILNAIQESSIAEQEIILCALVYDGNTALYKDVLKLNAVLKNISNERPDFYCASMNTAKN